MSRLSHATKILQFNLMIDMYDARRLVLRKLCILDTLKLNTYFVISEFRLEIGHEKGKFW